MQKEETVESQSKEKEMRNSQNNNNKHHHHHHHDTNTTTTRTVIVIVITIHMSIEWQTNRTDWSRIESICVINKYTCTQTYSISYTRRTCVPFNVFRRNRARKIITIEKVKGNESRSTTRTHAESEEERNETKVMKFFESAHNNTFNSQPQFQWKIRIQLTAALVCVYCLEQHIESSKRANSIYAWIKQNLFILCICMECWCLMWVCAWHLHWYFPSLCHDNTFTQPTMSDYVGSIPP